MRKLDSYVLREMIGPFVFGIVAFVIVLVSIDLLYDALKLVIREGYSAGAVAQAFLYRMPQTVALTLPMATMFSTLMAIGRLSGDGEVVAMRAGGVGFRRIVTPILLAGLLITGIAFAFNEAIVPHANAASSRLLVEMTTQVAADQGYLRFWMPEKGRLERVVTAEQFDPATNTMQNMSIVEFHGGKFWESFVAREAIWQGHTIKLKDVKHTQQTAQGQLETKLPSAEHNVGIAPWEVKQIRKDPEDMTLAELRERIGRYQQIPANTRPGRELIVLREHYHIRLAAPWCALGFALIGVSLGRRPQRTSTGVGLGVSLAVILAYYTIFNIFRVIGEQGTLPPVVAAWLPNLILFTIGGGLLIDASRGGLHFGVSKGGIAAMSTYTIVALIVLPITGGVIAWAGDVIGYRLGKRRSSIFGLRPRLTARAIGVAVGILLPLGALAVAAIGSEKVHMALFELDNLEQQQRDLTRENKRLGTEVKQAKANFAQARQQAEQASEEAERLSAEVKQGEERLQHVQSGLQEAQRRLRQADEQLNILRTQTSELRRERDKLTNTNEGLRANLASLESEYGRLEAEYGTLQTQYDHTTAELQQADASLRTAQHQITDLQEREKELESNVATLDGQISTLKLRIAEANRQLTQVQEELGSKRAQLASVRQELFTWRMAALGPVVYETGDEIFRQVLETHQTPSQIESSLNEFLVLASKIAQAQGVPIGETGRAVMVYGPVAPDEMDRELSEERIIRSLARLIRRSDEASVVVSVRALGRVFKAQPEPVPVGLIITNNRCVFDRGATIVTVQIDGGAPRAKIFKDLWSLLSQIRQAAQEQGILPAPGTGQYGEVPAEQVLAALDSLLAAGQPTPVYARATEDVYIANQQPFLVTLKVGEPSES